MEIQVTVMNVKLQGQMEKHQISTFSLIITGSNISVQILQGICYSKDQIKNLKTNSPKETDPHSVYHLKFWPEILQSSTAILTMQH